MSKRRDFIEKYFAEYLSESRIRNPFLEEILNISLKISLENAPIPPTSREVEELISYLLENNVDPVIVGSIAVIKHIHVTSEDIKSRTYRPTQKLELFVSKILPNPPKGWHVNKKSIGSASWISPEGGCVDFFTIEDIFDGNAKNQNIIGRDHESIAMGCPVADVQTIFIMKLNSSRVIDFGDLLTLAAKVGVPKDLDELLWNDTQKKKLEPIRRWVKRRVGRPT